MEMSARPRGERCFVFFVRRMKKSPPTFIPLGSGGAVSFFLVESCLVVAKRMPSSRVVLPGRDDVFDSKCE